MWLSSLALRPQLTLSDDQQRDPREASSAIKHPYTGTCLNFPGKHLTVGYSPTPTPCRLTFLLTVASEGGWGDHRTSEEQNETEMCEFTLQLCLLFHSSLPVFQVTCRHTIALVDNLMMVGITGQLCYSFPMGCFSWCILPYSVLLQEVLSPGGWTPSILLFSP